MSEGVGPGQLPAAGRLSRRRRWFPFWVVQATEIVVALVFADLSVHVANSGLLVGARPRCYSWPSPPRAPWASSGSADNGSI